MRHGKQFLFVCMTDKYIIHDNLFIIYGKCTVAVEFFMALTMIGIAKDK